MQTMAQLLATKGTEVWSIAPDATVYEGLRIMAEKDVGALVVVDNGAPIGLLTERGYARNVILKGRSSHDTPISAIMSALPVAVHPDVNVDGCMSVMTRQRTRHVLVMEDDTLRGIVSIGDLVKATIADQQFTIEQLEQYIRS